MMEHGSLALRWITVLVSVCAQIRKFFIYLDHSKSVQPSYSSNLCQHMKQSTPKSDASIMSCRRHSSSSVSVQYLLHRQETGNFPECQSAVGISP